MMPAQLGHVKSLHMAVTEECWHRGGGEALHPSAAGQWSAAEMQADGESRQQGLPANSPHWPSLPTPSLSSHSPARTSSLILLVVGISNTPPLHI